MNILTDLIVRSDLQQALELQIRTQKNFHDIAGKILGDSCRLGPLPQSSLELERNFFSTFFLAVTGYMLDGPRYMPLYAMLNQSMRAWVTACDNILDDEYKEIFPFVTVGRGPRMRSVLTLLVADRVMVEFVLENYNSPDMLRQVGRHSLSALLSSAIQESQEEVRPVSILPPDRILNDIHARKTGDLFVAPLELPLALEQTQPQKVHAAKTALRQFGLACQILDDIKDMPDDVIAGRHNLLVSLMCFGHAQSPDYVESLRREAQQWNAVERFKPVCDDAWTLALERFGAAFDAMAEIGMEFNHEQRSGIMELMCQLLRVSPLAMLTEKDR